jgi:hypothetical protein
VSARYISPGVGPWPSYPQQVTPGFYFRFGTAPRRWPAPPYFNRGPIHRGGGRRSLTGPHVLTDRPRSSALVPRGAGAERFWSKSRRGRFARNGESAARDSAATAPIDASLATWLPPRFPDRRRCKENGTPLQACHEIAA